MLHTFVTITSLFGYLIGCSVELLCSVAIIRKLNCSQRGDLVLIVSLSCADAIATWANSIGCMEALFGGAPFHPSSGHAIGLVQCIGWLSGALHMDALALNRFVAVFMPLRYEIICSGRAMARVSVFMWLFAFALALAIYAFAQPIVWSSTVLSSVYDLRHNATAPEPVYFVVDVVTYSSYVIAVGSYTLLILKVIHIYFCDQQQNGLDLDLRLCVQFVLIYVIFVLQAQSWRLLAWGEGYWYVVSYANVANFTINGYIYLVFNKMIRGAVKEMIGIKNQVEPATKSKPDGNKLFVPRENAPQAPQEEINL